MGTKRTVNARGLTAAVISHLNHHAGRPYTIALLRRELDNSPFRAPPTRSAINSALCRAARAGAIQRLGSGQYCARPEAAIASPGEPERVLDELLEVMAKAEPILHRCKRLLAAIQAAGGAA
jgi:hypothetical protein